MVALVATIASWPVVAGSGRYQVQRPTGPPPG